ncbi:MAG: peptidylprolyl isomerase [Gammaproteobacteria bacterium]
MLSILRRPALRRAVVFVFVLPLMFAGGSLVGGLQQSVGGVGDFDISRADFTETYREMESQIRRQYGRSLPPDYSTIVAEEARAQLVRQYLMRAVVADRHIEASDAEVAGEIRRRPEFQDTAGQFSISLFNEYTPDVRDVEEEMRRVLERRPLAAVLTHYPLPGVREKLAAYRRQQRIVDVAEITVTARFNISEDDIRRYYYANQSDYEIRQETDWEYFTISSAMFADEAPDEETVAIARAELEEEAVAAEQRTARHIYITGSGDEARARAAELSERARAAPESFADLAREFSEDEGSAENGGDLGRIVRGDLPEAMDEALFELADNEISGPVSVDGGYSVLKMEIVSAPPPTPEALDEQAIVRAAQIDARDKLAAKAEELEKTAHINVGSLDKVAEEAGVAVLTATAVTRIPGETAPDVFRNDALLSQLYVREILFQGETSPPILLDDDTYMMARTARHQPASTRPLTAVSEGIYDLLNAREQMLQMQTGENVVTIPDNLDWAQTYTLSLTETAPEGAGANAVGAVFAADIHAGLPTFALVAEAGKVRVFRVRQIQNEAPRDEDLTVVSRLLEQTQNTAGTEAYLQTLLDVYDVHFQPQQANF